jgi:hypothetical protein
MTDGDYSVRHGAKPGQPVLVDADGNPILTMRTFHETLECEGWGIVGEPQEGIVFAGYDDIPTIDVGGYSEADYWDGDRFKGPDPSGIVPIYTTEDGDQFPPDAVAYQYQC